MAADRRSVVVADVAAAAHRRARERESWYVVDDAMRVRRFRTRVAREHRDRGGGGGVVARADAMRELRIAPAACRFAGFRVVAGRSRAWIVARVVAERAR